MLIKQNGCISSEERDSKTELALFFSEDEDVKLLSVAAKAFPDQAQQESHQLLHYRQHGPKGKKNNQDVERQECDLNIGTS